LVLSNDTYAHQSKRVSFYSRSQVRGTPISWLKLSSHTKIGSDDKFTNMLKKKWRSKYTKTTIYNHQQILLITD